jgi:ERCC4-related helicase
MKELKHGQSVYHRRFGVGIVELPKGETAIVRFEHGLEECRLGNLTIRLGVEDALAVNRWSGPLETVTRLMAECIVSVNESWGVFSRSRIKLLPHQLWVCHRVLRKWPTQYLVADDVGLGKTIEAGLILWPLLSKEVVKRLLIVCPSSLVEQWQYRLREMFDIRVARYFPEADSPKADFWNSQNQVIASLQTIRIDHKGRHKRLLEADPWDLLIVDEAHHMNAHEDSGATLGYKLAESLISAGKIKSTIFFTGTPHRGKDYGFLALLKLLREDLFDPNKPSNQQLPHLKEVLIRNNKQNVVDMSGKKIFKPVKVTSETYSYTEEEKCFYELLTEFIVTGKAYASSLSAREGRVVKLVLVAMQKLASSSIAAIGRALKNRLARIRTERRQLADSKKRWKEIKDFIEAAEDATDQSLTDELQKLEENIVELSDHIQLMENELPQLETLARAAEAISNETKIETIIKVVKERFPDRQVLFFTEYKATQALLISALIREFGDDCVAFINGDNRVEGIRRSDGKSINLAEDRYVSAERFNAGQVRFLVSTEAAGEGIDLQENCWTLIHVDLPWNPMRLHQRVGRLNRYGQNHSVQVVNLRNPDTVESLIWDRLNEKIERIMRALSEVMDEPEDLMQLVLGMTSPSIFNDLFGESAFVSKGSLSKWFDEKTKTFGGKNAIQAVKDLVGNSERFDFEDLKDIPPKDLEDLQPFFEAMLSLNKRRISRSEDGLTFITPDEWLHDPGVRRRYERVVFSRAVKGRDAAVRVIGVGHKAFDKAIEQARGSSAVLSAVPGLKGSLAFFLVRNRVTEKSGNIRQTLFAITQTSDDKKVFSILKDWEALDVLNELVQSKKQGGGEILMDNNELSSFFCQAQNELKAKISGYYLPFELPDVVPLALLACGSQQTE